MPRAKDPERFQRRANRKIAKELLDVERRAYISKHTRSGASTKTIAHALGTSLARVRRYRGDSLKRLLAMESSGYEVVTMVMPAIPPDEAALRQRAYALKKRALTYADIARHLKISEYKVREYVRAELMRLEDEDLNDIHLSRQLHVAQLDAMMAGIMTAATGRKANGERVPPSLEAIDRMVKLMDQKAKLLGLNAPQTVDINHRLEILAVEFGYDVDELKEIAREVVQQRLTAKQLKGGS